MRNTIQKILKEDYQVEEGWHIEPKSEDDGLEWARETIKELPRELMIGQTYRVKLPSSHKAIIDFIITDMDEKKIWDDTRTEIFDLEESDIPLDERDEWFRDYNKVGDLTPIRSAKEHLMSGHWYPIRLEDSLFKDNKFIHVNESEEDEFEWVDKPSDEPFHYILMRDNDREPMLMDEIDRIMFNPAVSTEDKRFLDIAYWLEDNDYYPETIDMGIKTSYIELTRQKYNGNNGRWKIGPELNEKELYELSQTPRRGTWNGNFWAEQFTKRFNIG